jgi:hypothetical protein
MGAGTGYLAFRGGRMSEQNKPLPSGDEGSGQLPPAGVVVWVRAGGYRLMAYRDEKGVWRCVGTGEELRGVTVVEWPKGRL